MRLVIPEEHFCNGLKGELLPLCGEVIRKLIRTLEDLLAWPHGQEIRVRLALKEPHQALFLGCHGRSIRLRGGFRLRGFLASLLGGEPLIQVGDLLLTRAQLGAGDLGVVLGDVLYERVEGGAGVELRFGDGRNGVFCPSCRVDACAFGLFARLGRLRCLDAGSLGGSALADGG